MSHTVPVRVRIAPSPTGDPHVGTAYIALFNYVFAKKHRGQFILRIEDTDQQRSRPSSERMILDSLAWLGFSWDEGPDVGGPHGPYRQSERTAIYREHVQTLLATGKAYHCFCTADRLNALRESQKGQPGGHVGYDRHCRAQSAEAAAARVASGEANVVRLKMPLVGTTTFLDHLRGPLSFENSRIDDQVLLKSDGFPTYHLANVVDDRLMGITHVIRAEEWISSTPKHKILYEAFGWPEPTWIHMPLLRNSDHSKISKRKNPTSLAYYRRAGILPHALVNFLGLMGWSYGEDREIFSLAEMIEVFDTARISLGGPVFDQEKLNWVNQHYMHQMSDADFCQHLRQEVFSDSYLRQLKPLALERMARFEQFVDNNAFFFNGALKYDLADLVPKAKSAGEVRALLESLAERLDEVYEWSDVTIKSALDAHRSELGWKPKDFFMTLRLVLTGRFDSPPLVESLTVLGREMVRYRLRAALPLLTSG